MTPNSSLSTAKDSDICSCGMKHLVRYTVDGNHPSQ